MTRVAIIGARWLDTDLEREVLGLGEEDLVAGSGATGDEIVATARDADVILAGPHPRFDAATLGQLSCRAIIRYGVGYENVDIEAAASLGISVGFVPDYGTDAVAFHAVSLALAGLRQIPRADRLVKDGVWGVDALRPLRLPSALCAGVVGFGRIGRAAAVHFRNLGFGRVLACDEYVVIEESGIEGQPMSDLLADSDVVSLHTPGAADGSPLLGEAEIGLMRPGSIVVNTARGSLIDTDALVAGLGAGRPALAALDVFSPEPVELARFASVMDQVIMTPHMAWYTEESERALRVKTAEEGKRVLAGRPLRNRVPAPEVSQ